jgi:hypothetical protein
MRVLSGLVLAGAMTLGTACSPSPTIHVAGNSPAGSVSPGLISVPVGVVLGFEAVPESSDVVTASVDDPTVATVTPTTQASTFVVIGLVQGQTTLRVFAGGLQTNQLAVEVTPVALDLSAADASIPTESGTPFDPASSP